MIAENKRAIEEGEEQSRKRIAENMLKINLPDEIILRTTGLKEEELEKIKNKEKIIRPIF